MQDTNTPSQSLLVPICLIASNMLTEVMRPTVKSSDFAKVPTAPEIAQVDISFIEFFNLFLFLNFFAETFNYLFGIFLTLKASLILVSIFILNKFF